MSLVVFYASTAHGSPTAMPDALPFQPSEQLTYEAEFSRSLLRGINVAEFRFLAGERLVQAPGASPQTELLFKCEAVSKGFFKKLFGLNFRFAVESNVARDSFGVRRSLKHDEQGKRLRTSEAVFDHATRRLVWTERDPNAAEKAPRVVETSFGDVPGAIQDLASVFYYLRTQPLTNGKTLDLALSDSGRIYRVPVRVVGTKRLDTPLGKKNAVELDVQIFGADRLVEGEGKMSLWFTDDARRIPLRARIQTEIGTLTIKLKKISRT
jgi:hypothetical protein